MITDQHHHLIHLRGIDTGRESSVELSSTEIEYSHGCLIPIGDDALLLDNISFADVDRARFSDDCHAGMNDGSAA